MNLLYGMLHVETVKIRHPQKTTKIVNVICSSLCFKATQSCVILTAFEGRENYGGKKKSGCGRDYDGIT